MAAYMKFVLAAPENPPKNASFFKENLRGKLGYLRGILAAFRGL
jgi:hypothetical protein